MAEHDTLPESLQALQGTVGIWTTTTESLPATRVGEVAQRLDEMGYAALWLPEAWGREAFSNAQLQLAQSTRITIATGIANIWGRDAVAAANAARRTISRKPSRVDSRRMAPSCPFRRSSIQPSSLSRQAE